MAAQRGEQVVPGTLVLIFMFLGCSVANAFQIHASYSTETHVELVLSGLKHNVTFGVSYAPEFTQGRMRVNTHELLPSDLSPTPVLNPLLTAAFNQERELTSDSFGEARLLVQHCAKEYSFECMACQRPYRIKLADPQSALDSSLPQATSGLLFTSPGPKVNVTAIQVPVLTHDTAQVQLKLTPHNVTAVSALVYFDYLGNALYADSFFPRETLNNFYTQVAAVPTTQETDGGVPVAVAMVTISGLKPFTHFRVVFVAHLASGAYNLIHMNLTTDVVSSSLQQPPRPLVLASGADSFAYAVDPISPSEGFVAFVNVEYTDTVTGAVQVARKINGIDTALCIGRLSPAKRYTGVVNHLLPFTVYNVRTQEMRHPTKSPKFWQMGQWEERTETASLNTSELASAWSPAAAVQTYPSEQAPLSISSQTVFNDTVRITWQPIRLYAPQLTLFTVYTMFRDEELQLREGRADFQVLFQRNVSIDASSIDVNMTQEFNRGATHIVVTVHNVIGESAYSNPIAVFEPEIYVAPTKGLEKTTKILTGVLVAIAACTLIFAIFFLVRRHQNKLFVFPPKDHWELPRDSVVIGRDIGKGEFGVVRKGVFKNEFVVAIKSIRPGSMTQQARDFMDEATIMKTLCGEATHANVLQLIGVMMQDFPLVIVTEFVANGSLISLYDDDSGVSRGFFDNHQNLLFALDIARGMAHITKVGIIHRDLAARNCLVDKDWVVKIGDFGLARQPLTTSAKYAQTYTKTGEAVLPIRWIAPEVTAYGHFNEATDVWSYGVTLWEVFSLGAIPYGDIPYNAIVEEVAHGLRLAQPPACPDYVFNLMNACWKDSNRPTFSAIEDRLLSIFHHMSLDPYEDKPREHPELRQLTNSEDQDVLGDLASAARPSSALHSHRQSHLHSRALSMAPSQTPSEVPLQAVLMEQSDGHDSGHSEVSLDVDDIIAAHAEQQEQQQAILSMAVKTSTTGPSSPSTMAETTQHEPRNIRLLCEDDSAESASNVLQQRLRCTSISIV
eukprot:m.8337 g.8337  ORF g.8337 m.8337 type:complete len:1012 (-) comp5349_c0_seq1:2201-5236(-)